MPRTKKDKTKKTTAKKAPKVNKVVKEEPVQVAAPVENVVVVEKKEVTSDQVIAAEFLSIVASIQEVSSKLTALKNQLRALEKKAVREIKAANKRSKKNAKKGNRTPSGFIKPTAISDQLAKFLGKEKGTQMARTDVTKEINTYIRAHKLQDPKNGRIILADGKLTKLLNLQKEDELTYFNLQKFMKPHFATATTKATGIIYA